MAIVKTRNDKKMKLVSLSKFIIVHKVTLILALVVVLLLSGGYVLAKNTIFKANTIEETLEIDLPFDPEGPYALLLPRRDGDAINLIIKRVSSSREISYELAYQSEGIDRGVQGTINTQDKKSEYAQEILFGTCSQGFTSGGAHCVFDKNVENGTLTLRIKLNKKDPETKKTIVYKMITTWHLQKPDIALGKLTSGDNHFKYTILEKDPSLKLIGFSLINDLTGIPKLPEGKVVSGKVYGLNIPIAKEMPEGDVVVELAEKAPEGAKIYQYIEGENAWKELETKVTGSTFKAIGLGSGIFAVLVNSN